MAGQGDSYGASLSAATSSGASQSGAVDQGGSSNFGASYGPGSLIRTSTATDQRGSIGASAGGVSWIALAGIAIAAVFALIFILKKL
jgi:hypothetical protein